MIDSESATQESPLKARQLVKNGVWQVPPAERPPNWQTMAVREQEETVTHTTTKKTTEVLIQEAPSVTGKSALQIASETFAQELGIDVSVTNDLCETPPMSHLPKDGPYVEKVLDILHRMELCDLDKDWSIWEDNQEQLSIEQENIRRYRASKGKTDVALTAWVNRHRQQLRHIGINSNPIKDLWSVFESAICTEMEVADKREYAARNPNRIDP